MQSAHHLVGIEFVGLNGLLLDSLHSSPVWHAWR